jgi:hypothetical protein
LTAALEELTEDGNFQHAEAFAERLRQNYAGEFRAVATVARYECKAGRPERGLAVAEGYTRAADLSAGDHLARSARVAELLDELARLPNVRGTPVGRRMVNTAIERYAAMVSVRPEAVIAIAGLLAADGRVNEAFAKIEQFDRYLTKRLRGSAGLAAVRSGGATDRQFENVKGWLEACLAEEPESITLRLNEAEFLAIRQDLTRAASAYEGVLQRDPRNVVALNNLAWLNAADPKTAERALGLLERATREIGLTGELLDTRGRVRITLVRSGRERPGGGNPPGADGASLLPSCCAPNSPIEAEGSCRGVSTSEGSGARRDPDPSGGPPGVPSVGGREVEPRCWSTDVLRP